MKMDIKNLKLYGQAWNLSLFTVFYNIGEGIISMILGYKDQTFALFGFGVDSVIEVISGIGIAVMIQRIKRNSDNQKSGFEIKALRITGLAFYLLSAGLFTGIILNIVKHNKPETTFWGVIISLTSIAVMIWLMNAKKRVGKLLGSEPILADARAQRYVFICHWFCWDPVLFTNLPVLLTQTLLV